MILHVCLYLYTTHTDIPYKNSVCTIIGDGVVWYANFIGIILGCLYCFPVRRHESMPKECLCALTHTIVYSAYSMAHQLQKGKKNLGSECFRPVLSKLQATGHLLLVPKELIGHTLLAPAYCFQLLNCIKSENTLSTFLIFLLWVSRM